MNILLANVTSRDAISQQQHSFFRKMAFKLFIQSSSFGQYRFLKKPITLLILSALTPKNYDIEIKYFCRYDDFDYDKKYSIVGLSCCTDYAIETYKIADEFRKRGKTVVIGGWHASALPEEAKQHADSVVIGEAEETWPKLLEDYKNKKLKSFYYQKEPVNLEKNPILNYTKIRHTGIQATRGCSYGCSYCAIGNAGLRKIFRTRSIEDVIEEIKSVKDKSFDFYDNSMTIDPSYTKRLFKQMRGLNKKFDCYGNAHVLSKDDKLLNLASDAGCKNWWVGFESINKEILNNVNKKKNKPEEYIHAIKKIHSYGMKVRGGFILGFDYDTIEGFDKTIEFIKKSEMDNVYFHVLTPFPGTPIFKKFEREGRILTKDWSLYNFFNVVFQPKNMTPEQLYNSFKKLISWEQIYNHR